MGHALEFDLIQTYKKSDMYVNGFPVASNQTERQ